MSTLSSGAPAPTQPPPAAEPGIFGRMAVLKDAPRELWLLFTLKVLCITAYGITNYTLKLWLSSDFGMSDQQALSWVTAWSVLMSIFTVLVGSLTDALGLRRTFFLGLWIALATRLLMAVLHVKWMVLVFGLLPMAFGEALGTPVLVAGVRCYSNTKQRSISFSVFYIMMNFGFLIAGALFDWVRAGMGEYGHLTWLGLNLSTYQTLLLLAFFIEVAMIPIVYCLREGAEATDEGLKITLRTNAHAHENLWNAFCLNLRDSLRDTWRLFKSLVQQPGLYQLLGFLLLIAFLKLILVHMYYIYPTFGIRELGPGAPVGRLWLINSFLVIFLVPIVGALTQRISAYKMVILGGVISAASVFIMALPTAWFEPLANGFLGHWIGYGYLRLEGSIHPYYVMIPIFVVLLSVGEAFYSPRVYEYAAAIAPKGQEASYSALSYIPMLLAKQSVGTFLAYLLAHYCPETGPRHSGMMWLFVALTAAISPVGLVLLKRFIRLREAGREE